MSSKSYNHKQLSLVLLFVFITGGIFASEESMQINKEETKDIMTLFARENKSREARLRPAIKVKISAPVARTTKSGSVKSGKTASAAAASTKPVIYKFDKKTVWGLFTATVIEYPGQSYFKVSYDIQYTAQYVEVFDGISKNKVYTEDLNDISRYSFQVNYAFKPVYKLLLKIVINDDIQPVIIPLYEETTIKHK